MDTLQVLGADLLNAMQGAPLEWERWVLDGTNHPKEAPGTMLHAGMDLSRTRLAIHLRNEAGEILEASAFPPDRASLRHLVTHVRDRFGDEPVLAVIKSMNGARYVHDTLELLGWSLEIADATS